MASQRATVAALLRQHGGLTDDVARHHGVGELRKVIYTLRQAGWQIDTCQDVYVGTSSPACQGHYVLVQEPGQPRWQLEAGL